MLYSSAKSATYSAADRKLSSPVAVKILSPQLSTYPGYLDQFRNEALTAAQLRHPNICRVLDFGETDLPPDVPAPRQASYLAMEYMAGGSLARFLAQEPPPEPARTLSWLKPIAAALDYAHSQGVVHAGLKPTSVVFDEQSRPYLTDFAIASRAGSQSSWGIIGAPHLSRPSSGTASLLPRSRTSTHSPCWRISL